MLSTLPPSDPFLSNPFSAFDRRFTPWENPVRFSPCKPNKPATSKQTHARSAKPGSNDPKRVADERKRRRMISNRESARRSRMRKQKHLENLRLEVNRFRIQNRELNNRLQLFLHHCDRVRMENDWLRSEQTRLSEKLYNITQILVSQPFSSAWPCSNTIFTTE